MVRSDHIETSNATFLQYRDVTEYRPLYGQVFMCSISIGNYIYRPSLVDFCSLIAQYNDCRLGER